MKKLSSTKLTSKIIPNYYFKTFTFIALIVVIYFSYKIYVWMHTQSTDNAYVEADISHISAEVNGTIEDILVHDHQKVEANQIIAKIEEEPYTIQVDKAELNVQQAKREIEVIENDINLAKIEQQKSEELNQFSEENFKIFKRDYSRVEKLSEENYASKKNLDNTKIAFHKAQSELTQSQLNLLISRDKVSLLEVKKLAAITRYNIALSAKEESVRNLNNTFIRAPISGIIGNSALRKGNYVKPGVVLFSIIPNDKLYVKANFKETQIAEIKPGMKAIITIDSKKDKILHGIVRNIAPATGSKFSLLPPSNATGNFTKIVQRVPVIIDFEDHTKLSKVVPGMSVVVTIRVN